MKATLKLFVLITFFILFRSATSKAQETYVYVSEYSKQQITIYKLDPLNMKLVRTGYQMIDGSPFALTTNNKKDILYASIPDKMKLASFTINAETGALSWKNSINSADKACHLSVSKNDRYLLSAYFGASKLAIYPIDSEGELIENPSQVLQEDKWPHMAQVSPDGEIVYVPNMGADLINQYRLNQQEGTLTKLIPDKITTPYYTGPRHLAFHPSLNVVYFSMERSSQTIACQYSSQGLSAPFQTVDNLPSDYASQKWSSDIHVSPNGKYLYTANRVRPEDSDNGTITAFSVDQVTGELTLINRFKTQKTVRSFDIDPSGHFLIAAGEKSGKIILYKILDDGSIDEQQEIETGSEIWWVCCLRLSVAGK